MSISHSVHRQGSPCDLYQSCIGTWDLPPSPPHCYWHLVVITGDLCKLEDPPPPPPVLTFSHGHRNTYGWQVGGKHPTGMHSYSLCHGFGEYFGKMWGWRPLLKILAPPLCLINCRCLNGRRAGVNPFTTAIFCYLHLVLICMDGGLIHLVIGKLSFKIKSFCFL